MTFLLLFVCLCVYYEDNCAVQAILLYTYFQSITSAYVYGTQDLGRASALSMCYYYCPWPAAYVCAFLVASACNLTRIAFQI